MSSNAFAPQGNSVVLSVTTSSHAAVQVPGAGPANCNYVISVVGNDTYLSWTAPLLSGATPSLTTVIPVDGTPANGYRVLGGSKETITVPANAWFSAITASGTSSTSITPGEG